MRLTYYTDYSIRTLMYLALMPDKQALATIADIATAYDIPKSHLTKIVNQLATLGYIESVRGKNGGIRLAKASDEINIGQLVRKTEPDFNLVACFENEPKQPCHITPACALRRIFNEAKRSFLMTLDQYTLADTIANYEKMGDLLGVSLVDKLSDNG